MKKGFLTTLLVVTFFALTAVSASAVVNNTVKVGLRYGSSALPSANLENAVGGGYAFGYFDEDRCFEMLDWTDETTITMSPMAGGGIQGLVEVFSEYADQRLLQELIDSRALPPAFVEGFAAYCPAVEVESPGPVAQVFHPNGIQPAGIGLSETAETLVEAPLDSAEADGLALGVLFVAYIGAVLQAGCSDQPFCTGYEVQTLHEVRAGDYGSHHIPVPVDLEEAVPVQNGSAFFGEKVGIVVKIPFKFLCLRLLQRSSAVPYHAAATPAAAVVAGEIFGHDLLGNEAVAYLDYGSESALSHCVLRFRKVLPPSGLPG